MKTDFLRIGAVAFFWCVSAQAQIIDPTSFSNLTAGYVGSLVETTGLSGIHRPYAAATPLGVAVGLEIGADVTYVMLPQTFREALQVGAQVANPPQGVPIPKISIRKGLPAGIDLGLSGIYYTGILIFGGDLQWALLKGTGPLPAIAIRGGYTYSQLFFLQTHAAFADALISKNLAVFDPYVGGGAQFVSGSIQVPAAIAGTLPAGINTSSTGALGHVFGGFALKLFIVKIVAEADYNFNGSYTLGGRFAFSF
jgi:hypothetical protein